MYLNFKKIKIRISFFFLAFAALCCALSKLEGATVSLALIFWHELGHLAMICATGQRVQSISIQLGGFEINCTMPKIIYKRGLIYAGGIIFNILAAVIFKLLKADVLFSTTNILLLIVNMLPVSSLDGGRLFEMIVYNCLNSARADAVCRAVSAATSVFVAGTGIIVFAISGFPSLAIFGVYLIFTVFQQFFII